MSPPFGNGNSGTYEGWPLMRVTLIDTKYILKNFGHKRGVAADESGLIKGDHCT